MDPGYRSALIDFFRRGEVAADVRLVAAKGALAPRAHEQLAILLILVDDADPLIATTAAATIDSLPHAAVSRFLGRSDVPEAMRAYFAARGILPEASSASDDEAETLASPDADPVVEGADGDSADPQTLATLPVLARLKLAMRGSREQRAQLIRDSNKLVAAAVLSSPKLTEAEIESFARMANLAEEILRVIATTRAWTKNYKVASGLARNPKTPPALAMGLLQRLNERDLKTISVDRNVSEPVRLAAKKFVSKASVELAPHLGEAVHEDRGTLTILRRRDALQQVDGAVEVGQDRRLRRLEVDLPDLREDLIDRPFGRLGCGGGREDELPGHGG